jgi:hypothetical protein
MVAMRDGRPLAQLSGGDRMRRIRLYSAVVIGSLLATLLASAPAAALQFNPVHTLQFTVQVSGLPKPYALNLLARDFGTNATLQVRLTRRATTGNHALQLHQWYWQNATFTCSAHVASCSIDTITSAGAGSAGRIHLTFNATSPAKTTQDTCARDHSSLGSHTSRIGKVTGNFNLLTHTTFFGAIRNNATLGTGHIPASITAKATKWNTTGSCSGGCQTLTNVQVNGDDSSHIGANWFPNHPHSSALWEWYTGSGDLQVGHRILAAPTPGQAVTITDDSPSLDSVSVDLSAFAPFLSGSGTYTGGAPPDTFGTTCVIRQRNGTFNGTWTAKLDGWGTKTASGIALYAYAYKEHPGS